MLLGMGKKPTGLGRRHTKVPAGAMTKEVPADVKHRKQELEALDRGQMIQTHTGTLYEEESRVVVCQALQFHPSKENLYGAEATRT